MKVDLILGLVFSLSGGIAIWADLTKVGSGLVTLSGVFFFGCGIFLVKCFIEEKRAQSVKVKNSQQKGN